MVNVIEMDKAELEPIVRSFYKRAMEDPSDFSRPFHRVSLDHHVERQVDFLSSVISGNIDESTEKRLYTIHKLFVGQAMNGKNSSKWLRHMEVAVDENPGGDKLMDIVEEEMMKYGHQFGFRSRL